MSVEVQDNRAKLDAILREVAKLHASTITIGIHGDVGAEPKKERAEDGKITEAEGLSNITVAYAHEFGKGVPERSYLRTTVDARKDEILEFAEQQAAKVTRGRMKAEKAANRVGVVVVGMTKETILNKMTQPYGPLSDARVKQRQKKGAHGGGLASKAGATTPLIDTGQLYQSIQYKVEGV